MKKALLYLAFSILILSLLISYDITKCDGQVIMRHFVNYGESHKDKDTDDSADAIEDDYYPGSHAVAADDIETEFTEEDRGYEYFYGQLNEEEKEVYRALYKAFSSVGSGNEIPTISEERMNRVANYVRMDHPELFYVETMGYTHYTMGGQVQRTVVSANYSESKTVVKMELDSINRVVDEIIASFPDDADDYTKVKMTYEWVINNTEYNAYAEDNQTIKSVFFSHQSVCAGYARAMQYILNRAGVPTTCVDGASLVTGESHAWNLCLVDGEYYFVDATWGDASYKGKGYRDDMDNINYDYLLVTSEEIMRTHLISSDLVLPMCLSTKDNYFVREGLYLEYYDTDKIAEIFSNAYAEGKATVSFKCGNLEIYDEARKELISKNKVFEYLQNSNSTISYVEDEKQRTICFWL